MDVQCVICLDKHSNDGSSGLSCCSGHFVCKDDLNQYITENVFTRIYQIRKLHGAVPCPCMDCEQQFHSISMYKSLFPSEQTRYRKLLDELFSDHQQIKAHRSAILDMMNLCCPTCKAPVDPFPDACSAIMCLNCGNHYCNYCFKGFATGSHESDRSAAHIHVAIHSDSTSKDPFLSEEIVRQGHKEYRQQQLTQYLLKSLDSTNEIFFLNTLILCQTDLQDLGLDIFSSWSELEGRRAATPASNEPISEGELSDSSNTTTEMDDAPSPSIVPVQSKIKRRESSSKSRGEKRRSHESFKKSGGIQIANAIVTNNSQAVRQIIQSYSETLDVDFMDTRHGHPLSTLAILAGQPWVAKMLIERGANPMQLNSTGRSVLYVATESGLEDVVQAILEKNPNIDINSPTTTEIQRYLAIHVAARYNHGNLIRMLVEQGSQLDPVENEHGYTPLMLALVLGHEWAASELILAGANVRYVAANGRTPMFVAAEKGLTSVINLMIKYCHIDINASVVVPTGLRLLHVAAFHKKSFVVSHLIDMGANVNIIDDSGGYTPLEMAIFGQNVDASLELLEAGAAVDQPSRSGRFPLYIAIEKGLSEVVRSILAKSRRGVNEPATLERIGASPLHIAILNGQSHIIPILIAHGADVNQVDCDRGNTPLLMAVLLQDAWCVKQLLRAGADATICTREGRSPLYIATENGNSIIIEILVNVGKVKINDKVTSEPGGLRALHVAAMFDNTFAATTLVGLGAEIHQPDDQGRSPVETAKSFNSNTVLQFLNSFDKSGAKFLDYPLVAAKEAASKEQLALGRVDLGRDVASLHRQQGQGSPVDRSVAIETHHHHHYHHHHFYHRANEGVQNEPVIVIPRRQPIQILDAREDLLIDVGNLPKVGVIRGMPRNNLHNLHSPNQFQR